MPLNAGEPGYGSMAGAAADLEAAPLLVPEPEAKQSWQPLTKDELEAVAGGSRWRKARSRLVVLFWLCWLAMLGTAVAIIVQSPRPFAERLSWWQRTVFYQLQPGLLLDQHGGTGGVEALCAHLSYIKSLGAGALILEGLFYKGPSPGGSVMNESLMTLPQMEHLLTESNKVGLKVVLDFCELDLSRPVYSANNTKVSPNVSTTEQNSLRLWLEQGVAGFAICDTDPAYSEPTLLEWRAVMKEFSNKDEERIVVVKQTGDSLPVLNISSSVNDTLVDVVMKSILPPSHRIISSSEVATAIEKHLQKVEEDIWTSWMVGGKTSSALQKLLLVLMMTLPGSPAVQYGEEIGNAQNGSLNMGDSTASENGGKDKWSALALFKSLTRSKSREEALLFGSFTFIPFNTTSESPSASNSTLVPPSPTSLPILAFLRSWGCVRFLVLLNIGPDPRHLDPNWVQNLPASGVFVTSTGMDRLGSVLLDMLELKPQEAIILKLIKPGSYS